MTRPIGAISRPPSTGPSWKPPRGNLFPCATRAIPISTRNWTGAGKAGETVTGEVAGEAIGEAAGEATGQDEASSERGPATPDASPSGRDTYDVGSRAFAAATGHATGQVTGQPAVGTWPSSASGEGAVAEPPVAGKEAGRSAANESAFLPATGRIRSLLIPAPWARPVAWLQVESSSRLARRKMG